MLSLCIHCHTFSVLPVCLHFFNLPEFINERLRNLQLKMFEVFSVIRPYRFVIGNRSFKRFWCLRNVGDYLTCYPRQSEPSATSLSEHQAASCYVFRDLNSGISGQLPLCLRWNLVFCRTEWMAADFGLIAENHLSDAFNPLTPNDHYSGRTAPLTSKSCILYIYSTNIGTNILNMV